MNDRQLFKLFMSSVLPLVQATDGLAGVKLARNFQPRQHGASTSPYVYFSKLGDHRHGHPNRKGVWDEGRGVFEYTETEQYETLVQFSAWIPQAGTDPDELTESDILNAVSGIIQSDEILAAFRAQGVGVLRVTDVRNQAIVDERDQFATVPTFDVTLTHKRTRVSTIPAVATIEANLGRV
jgi:hypothetical protein